MGRKRKTRWRRLSIGGNSGNEEEEAERESEILGFSKMNPASRHRSGSQPAIINSFSTFEQSSQSPVPIMNGSGKYAPNSGGHSPGDLKSSDESSSNGGVNGYSSQREGYPPSYHHNSRGDHHQSYNNAYVHQNHHYAPQYNGKEHRGNGEGGYPTSNGYHSQSDGSGSGYYPSSNYYHHRNSYNQSYRGSQYERGGGYRGRGGDYHHSSRFGGRFRKPRPYASNYYYNNSTSNHQSSDEGGTNRPSYNQEEYTKITTPRQDVLFKKGYLSQRKPVTQSSSVDSTSGPTTPSTNGTPDTHSTNGINSDYSEGYENGETDCVGLPYDDTVYYGPPPETAVFTDPNTGQVYYGQSNGEYFDAYPVSPVMVGGYPTPVYYHVPYPGLDWNGLPTPIYPIVPLGPPPPLDNHQTPSHIQSGECHYPANGQKHESGGKKGGVNGIDGTSTDFGSLPEGNDGKRSELTTTPLTNGTLKNSKGPDKGGKKSSGKGGTKGSNGTLSDSSISSREGSTSTLSSAASTPLSPPVVNGAMGTLVTSMSTLTLGDTSAHHIQHLPPRHHGIPQPMPMSHYLAHTIPPPSHHHPQQILYHPHPAAFVYAPPIYNGVVVPIAPAASTAESQGSPNSRKKRKLRRRKKDDGQLTDESSSEESTISAEEPKDQVPPPLPPPSPPLPQSPSKFLPVPISAIASFLPVSSTSSQLTSPEPSPTKSNSHATKKDIGDETTCPENPTEEQLATDRKTSPGHKIESSQIPVDGDEVIKPKEETSSGETVTVNEEEASQHSVVERDETLHVQLHVHVHSSKKPKALTLNSNLENQTTSGGLETGDVSLLLPLKSPDTLEPSSPDSFNTTQSVAGSEVPSVSISETDFMNRTTSVDEVEEDLPPEEFFIESTSTPPEIRLLRTQLTQGDYEVESETSRSSEITQPTNITNDNHATEIIQSETIHVPPVKEFPLHESNETSPVGSPQDIVTKHSPSPETIFERSLELPVLSTLNVETLESLPTETLEPTRIFSNELCDLMDTLTVDVEELRERPSVTTTVPHSPASDDVQCIQINEPTFTLLHENKVTENLPPISSSPIDRPQSITLAVSEWLKIQGDDVLTPVNQLQAIFNNEDEEDERWTEDEEEELAKIDIDGNPKSTSTTSNCAIQ